MNKFHTILKDIPGHEAIIKKAFLDYTHQKAERFLFSVYDETTLKQKRKRRVELYNKLLPLKQTL
jgi:hypothetical protein